jgi:hypothetical protein
MVQGQLYLVPRRCTVMDGSFEVMSDKLQEQELNH